MSEVKTNKLTGTTSAGDVDVTSEGGAVTFQLQQGLAKAWINFNGTGTIASRDSFNIGSLTDVSTGKYLLSYSSSMGNDDYVLTGGARSPGTASGLFNAPTDATTDIATGSTEVYTLNFTGGATDFTYDFVTVQGDLA